MLLIIFELAIVNASIWISINSKPIHFIILLISNVFSSISKNKFSMSISLAIFETSSILISICIFVTSKAMIVIFKIFTGVCCSICKEIFSQALF